VTGATSGIGRATALELSRRGHNVILGVRNLAAAIDVAKESRKRRYTGAMVEEKIDVSDLASVSDFVARLVSSGAQLVGLINNAGVCRLTEVLSVNGVESTLATNTLGSYTLSVLCLKHRLFVQNSKIMNLGTHILPKKLDRKRIMGQVAFSPRGAYMQSKLAMILLAEGLAKSTPREECEITSICPGIVRSRLGRETFFAKVLGAIFDPFIDSPEKAATSICNLYERTDHQHGLIFHKTGRASFEYQGDRSEDISWLVSHTTNVLARRPPGI
jgi:retinol dehydrogenase-13